MLLVFFFLRSTSVASHVVICETALLTCYESGHLLCSKFKFCSQWMFCGLGKSKHKLKKSLIPILVLAQQELISDV